ncbi:MAG: N-acetylmuramoyl-L-alanine amidase [Bdellovibrionales bacterium]|nr:N-acetylmuramoyl-L-alanine amidase [Bdellovibrionales bacterium]
MLRLLDRDGAFARFARAEGNVLRMFRDRDGFAQPDFESPLAPAGEEEGALPVAATQGTLAGLRIALDPGHMGGEYWDRITGKFIHDTDGTHLSEGVTALQTCMLLERELAARGAEVMITRRRLESVSTTPYDQLDLQAFGRYDLRFNSLQDWFGGLLAAAPAGPALFERFERDPNVRRSFAEVSRWEYFIKREDLWARAELIRAFKPDLVLVVHYDISSAGNDGHGVHPTLRNMTKTYVAGGTEGVEWATRDDRRWIARHLLQPKVWWESVRLGRELVGALSRGLGIPKQPTHSDNAIKVEEGVFARNLVLSRILPDVPMTYLEVLFYNERREFDRLKRRTLPLEIGGESHPYSPRLNDVVGSLMRGLESYVRPAEPRQQL